MQTAVDVIFLLSLLGLEMTSRPESSIVALIGACWLCLRLVIDPSCRRLHAVYLAGASLFVGWLMIYELNPTLRMEGALGLVPVEHVSWLPGSAYPEATHQAIQFAVVALVSGGLALRMNCRAIRIYSGVLMAGGIAMAALAIDQRLAPNLYQIFPRTGWFTYENHYAAFSNLILPLFLATGLRLQHKAAARGSMASLAPLFYLLALVMIASVYLSRSRAGLAVSILIVVLFMVYQFSRKISREGIFGIPVNMQIVRKALAIGVSAVAGSAMAFIIPKFWGSWQQWGLEIGFRGQLIVDALTVVRDNPWYGTGPGTFMAVFPYYQSAVLEGKLINHVHSDPVEFLLEYGIAGVAALALLVFALIRVRPAKAGDGDDGESFRKIEVAAVVLGLGGLMLHSLVDFSWRSGPIAVMGIAYAAIWAGMAGREECA
jgi:O-antigen ligase